MHPHIARRVRVFHIHITPWDLQSSPNHSSSRVQASFTKQLLCHLKSIRLASTSNNLENTQRKRVESILRSGIESIKGLSNVEEYEISWSGQDPRAFEPLLIHAGWSVFGKNLRKLWILYPLDRITAVFPPPNLLENLHELDIKFFIPTHVDRGDYSLWLEALAHSINDILSTRSLRFRLMAGMPVSFDLSPFFRALKVLPRLQNLSIQLPLNREYIADPSALAHFINDHRQSLQHLALHTYHPFFLLDMQDESVCQMLSHILSVNLLSLELPISLTPDSILGYIRPFCQTLTSLVLVGGNLTYDQIRRVAANFVLRAPYDRLTVLSLNVDNFTPEILELLSDNFPSLKKLCITATNIEYEKFYTNNRVYREWKDLTSLWISRSRSIVAAWSMMMYLADHCIPTILECDKYPVWINRCDCAIITLISLRGMPSDGKDPRQIDGVIFSKFQVGSYVCSTHSQ